MDVLPRTGTAPEQIPEVASDDPWSFAREVDAAWLRTRPRTGPDRRGPVEAEHYLFYRGLGTFALPFDGRARAPRDAARSGGPARLDEIPETYREALILRLVEGLDGPAIAEHLGLTSGSVRVHLHRGLALLRPLLRKEGW